MSPEEQQAFERALDRLEAALAKVVAILDKKGESS